MHIKRNYSNINRAATGCHHCGGRATRPPTSFLIWHWYIFIGRSGRTTSNNGYSGSDSDLVNKIRRRMCGLVVDLNRYTSRSSIIIFKFSAFVINVTVTVNVTVVDIIVRLLFGIPFWHRYWVGPDRWIKKSLAVIFIYTDTESLSVVDRFSWLVRSTSRLCFKARYYLYW